MNRNLRGNQPNNEEVFAQAVDRLEAGEPIGEILASYPTAVQDELREMLSIVQAVEDMGQEDVPLPSAARRQDAKQQFLASAAQMRAQQEAQHQKPQETAQPATRVRPATHQRRQRRRKQEPMGILQQLGQGLQSVFSLRTLRLAPVIVTLAVVLLSTSTLVTVAQTAVPGDLAYSLKQWIRKQELELAPASQRNQVRQQQEQELAQDVARAADRADANSALIQAEDTLVFYGRNGRLLRIGGLNVMDRYQPNANVEVFNEMTVEGDLEEGALVELEYQIMPGQADTVQGISLDVVAAPSETTVREDAPQATEAVATQVPREEGCTVSQPEGWVPYEVSVGDNLTFLANRGGTTVTKIMEINCLQSETIVIGADLFVPSDTLKTEEPVLQCEAPMPEDWVLYEVQAGDSLTAIADRTDTTVSRLMEANCLESETILIGAQIYIPADDTSE